MCWVYCYTIIIITNNIELWVVYLWMPQCYHLQYHFHSFLPHNYLLVKQAVYMVQSTVSALAYTSTLSLILYVPIIIYMIWGIFKFD
jgi:hypothetical protein